ncbi:gluconokinase [Rouxiella badensis]|jgi:gluconokinase|uniref:Gluconokinase n=1 Tax=Rouxiella badensis TaxID=1646377 RepID=A0A1X0WF09_9GAMM|nr:gluconokinase [Rouxiella badensis]MCC3702777.1 gluconokinase [Rouxiella badensis]MCC3720408.1 gluconokinase [Rouxiella badensis]MCC3730246.1 gluconokinase [Rouxiella badensis]MCC3734046.1 gluconokinase [Rouxiella badensis]MCC3741690.1 gluconokinase [Rouxiella badensis]
MAGQSIILMGVSGSGKTTVGAAVARAINAKFIDGDDLHPRANIQKMASGQPLNDDDRAPWLERLSDAAYSLKHKNETGIIVCSALKRRYRDALRKGNDGMIFLYLKGSEEVILQRLKARAGHFFSPDMLKSQFAALEEPGEDETDVVRVNIDHQIEGVVKRCVTALENAKVKVEA